MADKTGYIGRNPADSTVRIARQVNTVVGVQTTFSFSSQYDIGFLDVYLNGVRLVNAVDYTATDGSNVIIYTPTSDGDTVEFVAYKAFNVAENSLTGDGSRLTGVVTSIIAGDNISISPVSGTGDVTITGLANTANVVADTLIVTGETTFTNFTVSSASTVTNLLEVRSDDGTPGRIDYYCESSNAHYTRVQSAPHSEYSGNVTIILPTTDGDIVVGNTTSVTDQNINTSGIITATSFSGDGSNLSNLDIPAGFNELDAALFN